MTVARPWCLRVTRFWNLRDHLPTASKDHCFSRQQLLSLALSATAQPRGACALLGKKYHIRYREHLEPPGYHMLAPQNLPQRSKRQSPFWIICFKQAWPGRYASAPAISISCGTARESRTALGWRSTATECQAAAGFAVPAGEPSFPPCQHQRAH